MDENGAYGERLRKTFKIDRAPSFVAKTLRNARIAVTEIRCDKANTGLSEPIPVEDAFLLTVQLRDVPAHGMFLDGQPVKTAILPAGTASFYDLRASPVADSLSAFHHVSFYVPRGALAAIAEKENIAAADSFNQNPGIGVQDPVLYDLVRAMLPCFRSPGLASPLFVDHLSVAAAAHAIKHHACNVRQPARAPKTLSPAEQARAKEKLAAHADGDLRLEQLSEDSGMSPLEFAASFHRTVGCDIHAWRVGLRIERAERLLSRGYAPETIARLLGYEHVSLFVEEFRRSTGRDAEEEPRH